MLGEREGGGKDGKASRRGRAALNEDDKGDLKVISSASSKPSSGKDFNGDQHGGNDANKTQVVVKLEGEYMRHRRPRRPTVCFFNHI